MKPNPLSKIAAAQKRVAIAKDAIKQIKIGKYNVRRGTWCNIPGEDTINQELLTQKRNRPVCDVCEVGALLASSIRLFNRAEIPDGSADIEHAIKQLKKYFSKNQLGLIEAVFEKRNTTLSEFDCRFGLEEILHAREGFDQESSSELALAILKNIITNKGQFIP